MANWRTFRLIAILTTIIAAFTPLHAACAQTPIRVALVSRTIFYLPLWVADQQGFFRQEGVAPQFEIYDGAEKILTDLTANTQQIGITSIENDIADAYAGARFRIVAGTAQRPPHFIIAQPEIKSLADLKGRLIGVVSMKEGTTFFVKDIAARAGFDPKDVRVEAVGGSPTRARLLKERKIDAGLQPYPLSYEAERDGFTNLGPIADIVPDYQFTSVVVADAWAKANRATLVAFLRALRRGTEYMFAHPDEAAELGAKELRTSVPFTKRALEDTARMDVLARDLSVTDKSLRRVFDSVLSAGLVPPGTAYDRTRIVDDSYLAGGK